MIVPQIAGQMPPAVMFFFGIVLRNSHEIEGAPRQTMTPMIAIVAPTANTRHAPVSAFATVSTTRARRTRDAFIVRLLIGATACVGARAPCRRRG